MYAKTASRGRIKFGDEPSLRERMLLLPKAYYYWGSRKKATLQARIQDMEWHNPIAIQTVVDKGGIEWGKRTAGEFLTEFTKLHEILVTPSMHTAISATLKAPTGNCRWASTLWNLK